MAVLAWEINCRTRIAQPQCAGTIASAVLLSPRSATGLPATVVIVVLGSGTPASWPGPAVTDPALGQTPAGDAVAGGEAVGLADTPCRTAGAADDAVRRLAAEWRFLAPEMFLPTVPEKSGLALNMVSTMLAIMARTRQPATSGITTPERRNGARHRRLRSCRRMARSSR